MKGCGFVAGSVTCKNLGTCTQKKTPRGHKISDAYFRSEGSRDFGSLLKVRRGTRFRRGLHAPKGCHKIGGGSSDFFFGIDAEVMSISLADRPSISEEFMSWL